LNVTEISNETLSHVLTSNISDLITNTFWSIIYDASLLLRSELPMAKEYSQTCRMVCESLIFFRSIWEKLYKF
jgi:hypothetical protein